MLNRHSVALADICLKNKCLVFLLCWGLDFICDSSLVSCGHAADHQYGDHISVFYLVKDISINSVDIMSL